MSMASVGNWENKNYRQPSASRNQKSRIQHSSAVISQTPGGGSVGCDVFMARDYCNGTVRSFGNAVINCSAE